MTRDEFNVIRALDLDLKIMRTSLRMRQWINYYGLDEILFYYVGDLYDEVFKHILETNVLSKDEIKKIKFSKTIGKEEAKMDSVLAESTHIRVFLEEGCNNYTKKLSQPMGFWTDKDVCDYLNKYISANGEYEIEDGDIVLKKSADDTPSTNIVLGYIKSLEQRIEILEKKVGDIGDN